ncbi:MAG: EAL domain-containing protein [Pseudohongiella sp.]|nr:EAL domain-containing protein [Pseudohongiella sp.]
MINWLAENVFLVYQFYGVAFVVLGATALALPRNRQLPFSGNLWLLGCFGILHGAFEFILANQIVQPSASQMAVGNFLNLLSFLALFEFGRRSVINAIPAYAITLPLSLLILLLLEPSADTVGLIGRYVFGVPGAALSGLIFIRARRTLTQGMTLVLDEQPGSVGKNWFTLAGTALLLYAALSLVNSSTTGIPLLPDNDTFIRMVGVPVAIPRALCAVALVIALIAIVYNTTFGIVRDVENILQGIDGFVYRCRNDEHWSLIYMAGNIHELSGYTVDDFRHPAIITLDNMVHPADRIRVRKAVNAALAKHLSYDISFRIVTRSGRSNWVSERGNGIYDQHGNLKYLEGHVFDADELMESQNRLERAEQFGGLGHWEFDPGTGHRYWSSQMFKMFNLEPADEPPDAERYMDLIHPDDREIVMSAMSAMTKNESPGIEIYRTNPEYGPQRSLKPSCQAIPDSQGRIQRYSGTVVDVTEQQAAMAALRESARQQQELLLITQREQGRMAALLSAMSIGILFEDRDGRVEYVNPAFRRMWAVDENAQLVGDTTRRVLEHSTHRFARPDHASRHVLHVLDTHEISERFEVDLYDGRILTQLSYPVCDPDGRVMGRLWIYEDVTHERQTAQQLVYLAEHDPLTGLHNRHRFQQQMDWMIASAERNNTHFALLYFDLDDFKYINDTFGHRAGDTVLVRTAGEVSSLLRQGEMFARLGGDEFAILTGLGPSDSAIPLAERVRHAIAALPFRFRGSNLRLTTSIGITIFPQHGDNTEDLIAHADSAMYQAKNAGKNNWSIYDPEKDLTELMIARMNWVSRVATCLEQGLFELHFQGIYNTSDSTLSHLEALVRMRDPLQKDSIIMPGQFIPVAEKSGQILEIDRWVLRESIRTLAANPSLPALAVNISGRSFDEASLPMTIHALLKEMDVAPERLIIELTETAAVSEMQDAQRFIEALQQTGCRVCLDDFGTGFSTFAYLKYLGVQVLKIDGLFIRDLPNNHENQAFVKAMIDVGRGLRKLIVAEFVEDRATYDMLCVLGVDMVQGYFLDRPIADHPALDS